MSLYKQKKHIKKRDDSIKSKTKSFYVTSFTNCHRCSVVQQTFLFFLPSPYSCSGLYWCIFDGTLRKILKKAHTHTHIETGIMFFDDIKYRQVSVLLRNIMSVKNDFQFVKINYFFSYTDFYFHNINRIIASLKQQHEVYLCCLTIKSRLIQFRGEI